MLKVLIFPELIHLLFMDHIPAAMHHGLFSAGDEQQGPCGHKSFLRDITIHCSVTSKWAGSPGTYGTGKAQLQYRVEKGLVFPQHALGNGVIQHWSSPGSVPAGSDDSRIWEEGEG